MWIRPYVDKGGLNRAISMIRTLIDEKSPKGHKHVKADVTDFAHNHTKAEITDFTHTHTKAEITDFTHKHKKADVTDFAHTHELKDISNFGESEEDIKAFRKEALECMASYLMVNYQSDCVRGYSGNQIAYVYNTNLGYMGLFGRYLKFDYSQKIDNKNVAHMDCAVFASLILKLRRYEESPYYYAFNTPNPTKEELYHRSLENYGLDKPYTLDFLNNLNTGRMIYQAYKGGLTIHKLSERKGVNQPITYFEDELKNLETGDIMFRGISGAINDTNRGQIYEGVDHTGIFVKDLSELNSAKGVPSGVTFHEITGRTSKYGYIVEFTGATEGKHKNCLRISALEKWSEAVPSGEWTKLFSVKPISNHMTSNKAHVQATGILKCYDFDVRVLQEMNGYYYQPCEIIHRISSGWIIKENEDLNDYCYDGLYQCNSTTVAKTLKNTPTTTTNYDLKCIGFDKNRGYGTQIAFCNSNTENVIYTRTCFVKGAWSPWTELTANNSLIDLTTGRNFYVDGSHPWGHFANKKEKLVTINIDLVLAFALGTGTDFLMFHDIPTNLKPNFMWREYITTEQGKRAYIEMQEDPTYHLCVKIRPLEEIAVNDRIRATITYIL